MRAMPRSASLALLVLLPLLAAAAGPPPAPRREVGSLVLDGVPEVPKDVVARMAQYQNTRGATLLDWTADGALLVATRFGDTAQLHRVAGPGQFRQQLTFFDEPVRGAAADPANANRLLLVMDAGGGEFYQFHRLDLATGTTTLLTDGRSRNESPLFAHAGDRFAFVSTRRNGKDFDLYTQSMMDPAGAKLVKELEGQWTPLAWSPKDGKLLLQRYVSVNESYLHVVDVATGAMTALNPQAGEKEKIAYETGVFLDETTVLASSDEGSEFQRLVVFDVAGKAPPEVLPLKLGWDVTALAVARDGRTYAFTVNEGGRSALYVGATRALAMPRRVALPSGVVSGLRFDREGRRLGLSLNAADAPDDAYVLDLKTNSLVRWTFSEVGGLNPKRFVAPTLVDYPSFDGRRIPAWLYVPREAKGAVPVIINIHGGPEGQSLATFSSTVQYWVNELGAAVVVPNVRGSSGYGKSWLLLDNAEKREDSVKDIGALLDWVGTRPELDAKRVAVIGGSYGGYMSLATMTHFSDRLRCGVDVVGISHFVTFLEHTESYRRDLRRAEYGDERDPAMRALLERISPLTNAAKIGKPLFVVQGANDPRVPASEAEQIVKTVREGGGTVWYMLAKDEGHGFAKKKNRDAYLNATSLFFETCLLK
jgi:dipeptidyl aminopeptidase/acylaminoacyl peptidase